MQYCRGFFLNALIPAGILAGFLAGSLPAQEQLPTQPPAQPLVLQAEAEGGSLYGCGQQRVLLLRGTAMQMGRQQGLLLAEEVAQVVRETLQWCDRHGLDRKALGSIQDSQAAFLPAHYQEEMEGLAQTSQTPLRDLQLVHAMPSRFHCSGAAVANSASKDGKLYHSRSLDYALGLGGKSRLQNHALLVLRIPKDGIPSAVPSWAGFLGAVTGMNAAGISVGEIGSSSDDETYAGLPMIFTVRQVLRSCKNLEAAVQVFKDGPRTCGFNYIVGDGDQRQAVAIEVTQKQFFVSALGDPAANIAPHQAIPHALRRANHFVGKNTAATQREEYDPRKSAKSSWKLYDSISQYLRQQHGKLDAPGMVGLLRQYPPSAPCLHQAVMASTDRFLWISQAADDRKLPFPGAQNLDFYGYDLKALWAGEKNCKAQILAAPSSVANDNSPDQRLVAVPQLPKGQQLRGQRVQANRWSEIWRWQVVGDEQDKPGHNPILELHQPRRVKANSPALLVFGSGNQRMLLSRALAQAASRLGIPVVLVQALNPHGEGGAAATAGQYAPLILPANVDRKRITYLGIGLGGPVAIAAATLSPKPVPLILAFTGLNLAGNWQANKAIHRSLAEMLEVNAEVMGRLPELQANEFSQAKQLSSAEPLLILGLEEEPSLPMKLQEELRQRFPKATMHSYPLTLRRLERALPDITRRILGILRR